MDNFILRTKEFLEDAKDTYIELIRGDYPTAFTRNRKVGVFPLMLQMFAQKGRTQLSELMDFYKELDAPLDISTVGFYNARMKFNPEALRVMSNDFVSEVYDEENDSMVKLNGYLITAIDGSDFILPSTEENAEKYGRSIGSALDEKNVPVMGKLSVIYDCINKIIFDSCVGEYKHSERDFASLHLHALKETVRTPTITIFDRGYFSMRLVNQMVENNQKFLFRLQGGVLTRYVDQVTSGEDKDFEVTFNRLQTNEYRHDKPLRMKLMNTIYPIRICKIPIKNKKTGKVEDEILLTNVSREEFDIEAMKELYHLRWEIETAYNVVKNRMKLEEFSGYRDRLIRQDMYACIWLHNIIMFKIIETNEKQEIPQERYKHEMKRNVNIAIGVIKSYFVKAVISEDKEECSKCFDIVDELMIKYLVPKRPDRNYKRGNVKNKSRMSYRYTY